MSLVSSLATINGLMRLRGDELPEPVLVSVYRVGWISVQLETEADLRTWAKHFGAEVVDFAPTPLAEILWGATKIHLYAHGVQVPAQRVGAGS